MRDRLFLAAITCLIVALCVSVALALPPGLPAYSSFVTTTALIGSSVTTPMIGLNGGTINDLLAVPLETATPNTTSRAPGLPCSGSGSQASTLDWPQLQNNPQRHGYSPENLDTPISKLWVRGFAPERLHPQAQPVIVNNRLFIGTAMGTFYAIDAATGENLWTFKAGDPILHTAGVANGRVFFGSMDGSVYALDVNNGRLLWRFDSQHRAGFSTAVLLAENKVFISNRGGVYYALNQEDGSVAWQQDIGVPIFMSSAYDNGRIFFGAMDMRVYALNSQTGTIEWQSSPVQGAAFKDYWPVAYKGYVFIRPMKVEGGESGSPRLARQTGPLPQSELDKQTEMIANYQSDPHSQNLFVFEQNDGDPVIMPHFVANTMNGATCPPAVDGDGMLIGPVLWNGTYETGWCRLDVDQRRIIESLWDGSDPSGNGDENLCISAAGRLVFIFHTQEGNAQFTGVWHLDRRESTAIGAYRVEGYFFSNSQGGGTTPVAISNGIIYHTTQNNLNARRATIR